MSINTKLHIFSDAHGAKDPAKKELTFQRIIISGTVAELRWEGLALSSIDSCEYSKSVNDSTEINVTFSYKPTNLTLKLTNLKPSTTYGIMLACYVKKEKYKSHLTKFTTSEYFIYF